MKPMLEDSVQAAEFYGKLGLPIMLLGHRSKIPTGGRGFKDAGRISQAMAARIERAQLEGQPLNLGLSLLKWNLSDGGRYTIALDVDPRNNGDLTLADLEDELPFPTWYAHTGNSGMHILYRTARPHMDFVGHYQGIDIKHLERGYIVVEPSVHPDTGRTYRWQHIGAEPPPLLPEAVEKLLLVSSAANGQKRTPRDPNAPLPQLPKFGLTLFERLFNAAGLIVADRDATGRVHVVCPNEAEHTTVSPASATSLLPSRDGLGVFRCLHGHCVDFNRRDVVYLVLSRHPQALPLVRRDDPAWVRRIRLTVESMRRKK